MNLKSTNSNQSRRWGNSRLASRSPSVPNSPGGSRLANRCRNCLGLHPTETCDIVNNQTSASPLRSLTPRRIPGNSKAYSRPCKYFALGKCVKGANCTFLHNYKVPGGKPGLQSNKSAPVVRGEKLASFTYNPNARNSTPKRIPAPLNLQEDNENDNSNMQLRPVSPQNIARSRPTSRATGGPNATLRLPAISEQNIHEKLKLAKLKGVFAEEGYSRPIAHSNDPPISRLDKSGLVELKPDFALEEPLPVVYTPDSKSSPRFDFPVPGASPRRAKEARCIPVTMDPSKRSTTPSKAFTRPCKYYAQGFCVKGSACTFLHSHQDSIALSDRLSAQQGASKAEKAVDPSKMFVRLCRYYIKNQCVKGMNCTFIHPTPEQLRAIKIKSVSPSPGPAIPSKSMPMPVVSLTDMQDMRSLKSMNAKAVEFRPASFRPVPRTQSQTRQRSSSPKTAVTEIQRELQNLPSASQSPRTCVNKAVAPPVVNESSESISLGDNGSLVCTNINQSKAKTKPCKFFLLGQCLKGDRCTFIHEIKQPEKPSVSATPTPTPSLSVPPEIPANKRVSSPRFARVENRAYSFNELDDIEDYVAGQKDAPKQTVANSNVAAVVLTFNTLRQEEINNTLSEIHNTIKQLNNESEENDYSVFLECYDLGCTELEPEQIADDIRRSDMDFRGRREALCQPRFGHILRALKRKGVIPEKSAYLYQIEAVNEKYAFKYPYANISMVFQKGDKGERIEQVAIRGLFEKQHVILDRKLWDKAWKARAPPIYLPYFLTGEQLAKYPESRRVWFCGAHSLFVPALNDVEFIRLEQGQNWPAGADVPSRYAANPVPVPTLFITHRLKKKFREEIPIIDDETDV